jgi:hypothetical protein
MWQIDNRTPFAADRGWVRDRRGTEVWLVAVKCTFDVRPDGSTVVSAHQPPVLRAAEYTGAPGKSSLRFDSDLILTKKTTDVIVVGDAHAPGGRPVAEMDVGLRVGPIQKILRVVGDRVWGAFGASTPEPFVRMPLLYECAFGGVDGASANPERSTEWRNPVGTGFALSRDHLRGVALPNIEYRDDRGGAWKDRPRPAGFGPLAPHWQPRVAFAGTYDEAWRNDRQPLLPADFDDRFYQCAPQDQQTPSFLRGGEPVVLYHLTPGGELRFSLPKLFLGFVTQFSDRSREVHQDRRLHTVIIDTDGPRVSLVWHTALPCHSRVQRLERTFVALKAELGATRSKEEASELEPACLPG